MKCTVATALLLACSAIANPTSHYCKDVNITASGSADNKDLSGIDITLSLPQLLDFFNNAPIIQATGNQTLAATFCTPYVKNGNNDKIQTFFGSITADRGGWNAQGTPDFPPYKPEYYSWVEFANRLGYPTLAFDRLGTGKSSHPDPILVAQAAYEIALYANVADQVRSGKTGVLPRAYKELIYVGNSYGSQLGAGIAGTYPNAFDKILLTGFSYDFQQDFLGVSLALPLPAQLVDPARFLSLPIGYVTTSLQVGRTNAFFGSKEQVDFEDQVATLFYQRKDVVSLGQFLSIYAFPFNGKGYTGRVFVLNGQADQAACGPGSPVLGPANCTTFSPDSQKVFPDAEYNWKNVPKTGHAIQLHLSAPKVFALAHQFLAGAQFSG